MTGHLHRRLPLLTSLCLAVLLAATTAQAWVIDPQLQQSMYSGDDVDIIVQFNDKLDIKSFRKKHPAKGRGKKARQGKKALLRKLRDKADSSQQSVARLLQKKGVKRFIKLWSINALATTVSPETVELLATLPEVDSIRLDAVFEQPVAQLAPVSATEWNLDAVRAPELWDDGFDGTGTVVAIMDTGVDVLHSDLAPAWRNGTNSWFDPSGEHSTPYDASGHGTQVAGVLIGGDAGGTSIGVAPGAQWIAVKIFNDAGVASESAIHQGFQWLLDPDGNPETDDVPDVVNNSWGFPNLVNQCYMEFNSDIELLKSAGIAVVFSGGNQGNLGSVSPGDNPASFAVGAIDSSLTIAATSSRGPSACDNSFSPEVVAPGVNIWTADLTAGGVFPESYTEVDGSSFAAPHVAGTMALLREAHPNASVEELEQALKNSAFDLGPAGVDNEYGYGLVDVVAADQLLDAASSLPVAVQYLLLN